VKRILVADDEESLRYLITETLELGDYEILQARDGEEAFRLAIESKPDLILLDMMMPKMTGFEVTQALRERGETTTIVLLTARSQKESREKGLELGANYYLIKPFSPLELLNLVDTILGE